MLIKVTRASRWRAAVLLTLIYALSILSPAMANAFSPVPVTFDHHHGVRAVSADHHVHDHENSGHSHHKKDNSSKSSSVDLQCCGLACISALPAVLAQESNPARMTTIRMAFVHTGAIGQSPPRQYRPPIL